jgi:hypothetical protein
LFYFSLVDLLWDLVLVGNDVINISYSVFVIG